MSGQKYERSLNYDWKKICTLPINFLLWHWCPIWSLLCISFVIKGLPAYHIHDHWNKVIVLISNSPLFFFLSYHPCLTYCRLPNGQQCLFAAKDDREMMYWVCRLDAAGAPPTPHHGDGYSSRNPAAITTIPPPTSGSPTRSERFKNLIKGGISALLK